MFLNLPIQIKEIKDGKLFVSKTEKKFELDMSIAAQMRFERKFPDLASREDLVGYSKRICEQDTTNAGILISKLKLIYCWFDTELTFIQFLKLFDLTDAEYTESLLSKINEGFTLILDSSSEKK